MNWLRHPLATAAANAANRFFGGRLGCLSADDARQEGAIRAWQHGGDARAGKQVVIDILRRVGAVSRDGVSRVDRRSDVVALEEAEETADTSQGPEQKAMAAQSLQLAVARLASMPDRWQQVATGILQGDAFEAIGNRLEPPVSPTRVSQMLRQIIVHVDGGPAPWKAERGETADTTARPSSHVVRVAHAMQAVRAKSRLDAIIDAQRKRLREIDTATIEAQAAAGRAMYQQMVCDEKGRDNA